MSTINNCNFIGVQYDETTLETIHTVAKSLLNLTELFRSQNIHIDCLLKIDNAENDNEHTER